MVGLSYFKVEFPPPHLDEATMACRHVGSDANVSIVGTGLHDVRRVTPPIRQPIPTRHRFAPAPTPALALRPEDRCQRSG